MTDRPVIITLGAGARYNTEQLNSNFVALRNGFDDAIGRLGTSGSNNTATGDMDMDGNDIRNVGGLTDGSGNDVINAAQYAQEWATQIEDTLISVAAGGDGSTDYSSLHWAAKSASSASSASTSASNASTSETNAAASAVAADSFVTPNVEVLTDTVDYTSGTSTTVTLAATLSTEDALLIFMDSVHQGQDTFSIAGTPSVVTFDSTIATGTNKIVVAYGTRSSSVAWDDITGKPTSLSLPLMKFDRTAPPTANSDSANTDSSGLWEDGSVWVDVTNDEAYRCVDSTPTAAIWIETTLSSSEIPGSAIINDLSWADDQTGAEIKALYEAEANTNAYTDSEKTVVGATSGTNTGDEAVASLTVSGTVELATITETNTGTDATRAVTPDGLDGWTGSAQLTTVGTISSGTWNGDQLATTYLADEAITYAKMQHVSATDKLLGRSTAGAGDVEEIACTAAGRALIDDANASAQRTTLGLGSAAIVEIQNDGVSAGGLGGTDLGITHIVYLTAAEYGAITPNTNVIYLVEA